MQHFFCDRETTWSKSCRLLFLHFWCVGRNPAFGHFDLFTCSRGSCGRTCKSVQTRKDPADASIGSLYGQIYHSCTIFRRVYGLIPTRSTNFRNKPAFGHFDLFTVHAVLAAARVRTCLHAETRRAFDRYLLRSTIRLMDVARTRYRANTYALY